jgi:hypothetical protein
MVESWVKLRQEADPPTGVIDNSTGRQCFCWEYEIKKNINEVIPALNKFRCGITLCFLFSSPIQDS